MIHLRYFCVLCEWRVQMPSFIGRYPVVSTPFVEMKTILSSSNFSLCQKNWLQMLKFILELSILLHWFIVDSGLLWGQGHQVYKSWQKSFWRRSPLPHTIVWPQGKPQGGNIAPPINRNWIKDLLSPTHQSKNQNPPQSVPPTRKPSQASYPYPSDGRQTMKHNYRKLTQLITWITAVSNSMKIWAKAYRATQDRWVMVERSDKTWPTGEGNGKPLQYSCLENPMNGMKRQTDMTLKDELPRSVGAQYVTGEEWRNSSRKKEKAEPKWKQCWVVDVTGWWK